MLEKEKRIWQETPAETNADFSLRIKFSISVPFLD